MKQPMRIGVVIADEQEYKPVRDLIVSLSSRVESLYGDELTVITLTQKDQAIEIYFVLCGIGKVNAAASTAYLIARGAEYIINSGLSGGIAGVARADITLGDKYIEHDFDLTPLGYKPAQKPQERFVYEADEMLLNHFRKVCPAAKIGGMACGDSFVSDDRKRLWLKQEFSVMSCDMESAAVASVCAKAGVPFLALRRISDDAGNTAAESYEEMNERAEATLIEILMDGIGQMFFNEAYFPR